MAELAAEYSEGLCDAVASLKLAPRNSAPKRTVLELEGAAFTAKLHTKILRFGSLSQEGLI